MRLTIRQPDDWHVHLRDGAALATTVKDSSTHFARVMVMPNTLPPVTTVDMASAYRSRIMQHVPAGNHFSPMMALYLTEATTAADIHAAAASDYVKAIKYYPAGATTNSHGGARNILALTPVLEALEQSQLPLLLHGEVTTPEVDIFDREKHFIDEVLAPMLQKHPRLKVVFEHATTKDAVDFVQSSIANIAATLTPQHILYNRNHMLVGGLRPHYYCLPILKRRPHQEALLAAATSGNAKFFLGTDSAPHEKLTKESSCGCAGCYTAPIAMALYAEAFESVGALAKLENFASVYGAQFYGLPLNSQTIALLKQPYTVPQSYPYVEGGNLVPLRAGETLEWCVVND